MYSGLLLSGVVGVRDKCDSTTTILIHTRLDYPPEQ